MKLHSFDYTKPDGRKVRFYSRTAFKPLGVTDDCAGEAHSAGKGVPAVLNPGVTRNLESGTAQWKGPFLRKNQFTGESISMSASRQHRPFLPAKNACPLCPPQLAASARASSHPSSAFTSSDIDQEAAQSEIPLVNFEYDWVTFENLFPALWPGNETGVCEVILYAKDHDSHIAQFTQEQIVGLVKVWQDRSYELGSLPYVDTVYIFENRGAEIGVTLHHPHGQIYAFAETPPRLKTQLEHAEKHYSQFMSCLVCDVTQDQIEKDELLLYSGQSIVAYIPYAPRFPYELCITTKKHRTHIHHLNDEEVEELALLLKEIVAAYDKLFGFSLPYIMQHHQCPSAAVAHSAYHWNIQITPFHRSKEKLKYLAGAETGMGFFINDSLPEEKIKELRSVFRAPQRN